MKTLFQTVAVAFSMFSAVPMPQFPWDAKNMRYALCAFPLIGVLIANGKTQAVAYTKLEELTREVREHNNFARRVPILEEQMKVANHRIADLEKERN